MTCKCAVRTDEYHGWKCSITEGSCIFRNYVLNCTERDQMWWKKQRKSPYYRALLISMKGKS